MSESNEVDSMPRRRKGRRRPALDAKKPAPPTQLKGIEGGHYSSLSDSDMQLIDRAVRATLQDVGMAEAPDFVVDIVAAAGGRVDSNGRLLFPAELIDRAIKGLVRNFTLYGQTPEHQMQLGGNRVHMGTGGAAPRILDLESGCYRDSVLQDIYDAARLVDQLEHIHFFSRPLVARDMTDLRALDLNTAYACLQGTSKHVFTSISHVDHVEEIADLCFTIAGSKQAFLERPFLSLNINHVVPPLRFDAESCAVMVAAARIGIPIHANTFGQMGASSPVTIAGSLTQTIAETLSGMILSWLVNPEIRVVFGTRPMVTDLRTGGMGGGGGEQALLMAATAQMARYYDLANSSIAGATDSKLADAQSGFEKCLTVSLVAQAGSNLITQASGMQASLMGCALESYLIDNDMLGSILSSLKGIDVSAATLNLESVDAVVHGEGHFLGQADTLQRMQSDFVYPKISDRRSIDEWESDGSKDIRTVARERVTEMLDDYYPDHISAELDRDIRSKFDIKLAELPLKKR